MTLTTYLVLPTILVLATAAPATAQIFDRGGGSCGPFGACGDGPRGDRGGWSERGGGPGDRFDVPARRAPSGDFRPNVRGQGSDFGPRAVTRGAGPRDFGARSGPRVRPFAQPPLPPLRPGMIARSRGNWVDRPGRYGLPPLRAGQRYLRDGPSIFVVEEDTARVLALALILRGAHR